MSSIKLKIIPEINIFYNEENKILETKGLPARCKLLIENKRVITNGWYLLKGRVERIEGALKIKLIFKDRLINQLDIIYLPATCKGTILEVIKIPENTDSLFIEILKYPSKFKLTEEFSLKPLGNGERIYRMLKRVLNYYKAQYKNERKILGLSLLDPFINLQKAYHLVNKIRDCDAELDYSEWIEIYGRLTNKDIKKIKQDLKNIKYNYKFLIIILADESDKVNLNKTIQSLNEQLYRNFSITVYKKGVEADLKTIFQQEELENAYIIILEAGTILYPHTLYSIAKVANLVNADLIYTDHDYINRKGERVDPQFKPDFSLELLRATNYIKTSFAIKGNFLKKLDNIYSLDLTYDYAHSLLLKIVENDAKIEHVPAMLFSLPYVNKKNETIISNYNPVTEHLMRKQISATVEKTIYGHYKIIYHLKEHPLISIIIPTKDQFIILKKCIESIREKTTYQNYEIIVVDNQSREPETLEYFESLKKDHRIKIMHYNKPFNYSEMNNIAVKNARGDVIVFLNNDTTLITPDWLEVMLGYLQQPRVGAVGVKLYYYDGRIQHAGVILGAGGCADHAFKGLKKNERGYMDRAFLPQEYLAVTSACMMTWKRLFFEVGGFDEVNLQINFNDVDYCLKLREAGYKVIYTPYVELYHYESLSRGKDIIQEAQKRTKKEADFIRKKWKRYIEYDPFYNPNLNFSKPDFSLTLFSRAKKLWE